MLTFSKVGKKGNLGNQLFQIASTIGLAVKHGHDFAFLPWQYQSYFKYPLPLISELPQDSIPVQEKDFHVHDWEFPDHNQTYDLLGWLQSEKYFDSAKTRHYFEFTDAIKQKITDRYERAFQKPTILISIRRGDFVNHPDYLQLPIKFYLNALALFFPDWTKRNLVVLSDDIDYCKFHFSFLENVFFGDGLGALEQLCLGSLCDDFIISNSTFSWWTAWLGGKPHSKVICPHQNFDGQKRLECNDRDYYPERWIQYRADDDKIYLPKVRFEFRFKKNQDILKTYLAHYFNTSGSETSKAFVFHDDYFLPPLMVYYGSVLKSDSPEQPLNFDLAVFKVSRRLNYEEFSHQQDFGLFSTIFRFCASPSVRRAVASIDGKDDRKPLHITGVAGQFTATAFRFSLKRNLKQLEIALKTSLKKTVFFRKK